MEKLRVTQFNYTAVTCSSEASMKEEDTCCACNSVCKVLSSLHAAEDKTTLASSSFCLAAFAATPGARDCDVTDRFVSGRGDVAETSASSSLTGSNRCKEELSRCVHAKL